MAGQDGDWEALAYVVKARRRELGIPTQAAAAELADISKNTWQRLENGRQISMTSLNSVAAVLRWHRSYPVAVLEQGIDAPKHVMATGQTLGALTASMSGTVAEPVADDSEDGVVGEFGETVVARPETVRATSSIPGPARPPARVIAAAPAQSHPSVVALTPEVSVLMVSIPLTSDESAELEPDDLAWLSQSIRAHGSDLVKMVVAAKRRGQPRQAIDNDDDTEGR